MWCFHLLISLQPSECGSGETPPPPKKAKDEPKVTPFKLKIPPKAEVASGSESSSGVVKVKKKKSKKSKKRDRKDKSIELGRKAGRNIKTESDEGIE